METIEAVDSGQFTDMVTDLCFAIVRPYRWKTELMIGVTLAKRAASLSRNTMSSAYKIFTNSLGTVSWSSRADIPRI